MKIDGACHCGEITYEAEVDPERILICHCTDCQTLSGSAYRTIAPTVEGTFRLLSGNLKTYIKTAEDGNKRAQAFCPDCGTPIYAAAAGEELSSVGIRLGTVRQREQLQPQKQKWCRSAQSWSHDLSGMSKIEKQ